jgi:hypothetical protein
MSKVTSSIARSGTFAIGNEIVIHRMGFGAMQITGYGVWGPPRDKVEALGGPAAAA